MKRFGITLLGVGVGFLFFGWVLSISPIDRGWSRFFLKARLTEMLEKSGYMVIWERKNRTELPLYLNRIIQINDSSPIDTQALSNVTANGLRITTSGVIHFIEVGSSGAGLVLGLFERPLDGVHLYKDTQILVEQSFQYSPLHHWHKGREFLMHTWIRMETGLRYETLPDFFPLEEIHTLSTMMSEKEKGILSWTQRFCFILAMLGIHILLRHRIHDILQRAWRYCVTILTDPLSGQPYSAPSILKETTTDGVAVHLTTPSPTSLSRYVSARRLTQPKKTAVLKVKPVHEGVERILSEIKNLYEREGDPDRKKALGEICAILISPAVQSIRAAQFYLSRARALASLDKQEVPFGEMRQAKSLYEHFRPQLLIDDFVPKHLELACVQTILLMFLSPGTHMLRFGDHPLGYIDLKKALLRKGMLPDACDQSIDWLDKIRVIVDIKGGYEIRRKRAKSARRYSINARRDNVQYPADKIINLMIIKNNEIMSSSSGKG